MTLSNYKNVENLLVTNNGTKEDLKEKIKQLSSKWTLEKARELCVEIENEVSKIGWHIGLTGGCLYSEGERKDLDIIFYPTNNNPNPNDISLVLKELEKLGIISYADLGFCVKAVYKSYCIDLMFVLRRKPFEIKQKTNTEKELSCKGVDYPEELDVKYLHKIIGYLENYHYLNKIKPESLFYTFDYEKGTIQEKNKWAKMYLDIALRISKESKANRLQVGSVFVSENGVMSIGINGLPPKSIDICEDSDNKTLQDVSHAEENLIFKLLKEGVSTKNGTIYQTHSPCVRCTRLLANSEIKTIYFLEKHDSYEDSKEYLLKYFPNIQLIQFY